MDPGKLHVKFHPGIHAEGPHGPRRYTLTHSDFTGDLFLSIGAEYDWSQIRGWYTRLMRDEVLAELLNDQGGVSLHVYVHVSGGFVLGGADFRNAILHHHMPMVLEAIRHGDREFFNAHPELEEAKIMVHFAARQPRYHNVEEWGRIGRYRLP